jgi:hypothetical protein
MTEQTNTIEQMFNKAVKGELELKEIDSYIIKQEIKNSNKKEDLK